jgi:CBS domain containing-hemolysin-like protein
LLLDLALSAALLAVSSLSRVAVRRLSQETPGFAWVEDLRVPHSSRRMAAQIVRQASLLGASFLCGAAASAAPGGWPWVAGLAAGIGLGVLAVETIGARLLARRSARGVLRATAPVVRFAHVVARPVVAPLALLAGRPSPAAVDPERDDPQDEEVEALIEVGRREGILEASEGEMVRGIVDIGDTRVREIMTPRTDIDAFEARLTVREVRRVLVGVAHSRFPVYRGSMDNVVGILHTRDLLRAWEEGQDGAPITAFVRPALFVPETQLVSELLAQMRVRTHVAVVVDEYGGVAGLVTLEDLLEEIVGDIRDEHDVEEALIQPEGESTWVVNGLAHVEQLEALLGLEIHERDYDTVGGLVVSEFGRVPAAGETLVARGVRLEVVESDRRRVYRVRVRRAPTAEPREPVS